MTATPLIVGDTVYVQDMQSNVFALDRADGTVKWNHHYDITSIGPNGLAIGYGLLYGTIGDTAEVFALAADTGTEVWRVRLSHHGGEGVDMAPTVYDNTVYVSTVPGNSTSFYGGGRKGILYALDARDRHGALAVRYDHRQPLGQPAHQQRRRALGAALGRRGRQPLLRHRQPGAVSGCRGLRHALPQRLQSARAQRLHQLDGLARLQDRARIRWYHNAKPHDLFDLDFQLTPILTTLSIDGTPTKVAIGGGKAGTVIACNADTGDVLWEDDGRQAPER